MERRSDPEPIFVVCTHFTQIILILSQACELLQIFRENLKVLSKLTKKAVMHGSSWNQALLQDLFSMQHKKDGKGKQKN